MLDLYYKNYWFEFMKCELEDMYNAGDVMLFKYNSVYEIFAYPWKDWIEYGLRKIRQLQNRNGLPYTKKGRYICMNYNEANKFMEKDFFII